MQYVVNFAHHVATSMRALYIGLRNDSFTNLLHVLLDATFSTLMLVSPLELLDAVAPLSLKDGETELSNSITTLWRI